MNTKIVLGKATMTAGYLKASGLGLAWLATLFLGCAPLDEMGVEEEQIADQVEDGFAAPDEAENVAEAPQALSSLGFSTFFGSSNYEGAIKPVVDAAGYVYVGGWMAFPNKGKDVTIAKFSPSGARLGWWAFGGVGDEDVADIAVDAAGNCYVVAKSTSYGATKSVYVAKFFPGNGTYAYKTFGGSGDDRPRAIAVDPAGGVYITGKTTSADFPVTSGTYQSARAGQGDAFVTKLDASFYTVYSTFLGGDGDDEGNDIAVDNAGYAYVVGSTMPQASGGKAFPVSAAAFQTVPGGSRDAFVTELLPNGALLFYSTLLGGSSSDTALGVAVDGAYQAHITGLSQSGNFPTTAGAFRTSKGTTGYDDDSFVVKLNYAGSAPLFSTFLASAGAFSQSIAVGNTGKVYVAGTSSLPSFPATSNGYKTYMGGGDAYLLELNPQGSLSPYATFLSGSSFDIALGVAVDSSGNAYVAGTTDSPNFITSGASQPTFGGARDGFLVKLVGP